MEPVGPVQGERRHFAPRRTPAFPGGEEVARRHPSRRARRNHAPGRSPRSGPSSARPCIAPRSPPASWATLLKRALHCRRFTRLSGSADGPCCNDHHVPVPVLDARDRRAPAPVVLQGAAAHGLHLHDPVEAGRRGKRPHQAGQVVEFREAVPDEEDPRTRADRRRVRSCRPRWRCGGWCRRRWCGRWLGRRLRLFGRRVRAVRSALHLTTIRRMPKATRLPGIAPNAARRSRAIGPSSPSECPWKRLLTFKGDAEGGLVGTVRVPLDSTLPPNRFSCPEDHYPFRSCMASTSAPAPTRVASPDLTRPQLLELYY